MLRTSSVRGNRRVEAETGLREAGCEVKEHVRTWALPKEEGRKEIKKDSTHLLCFLPQKGINQKQGIAAGPF
jgi:hypothetical protein